MIDKWTHLHSGSNVKLLTLAAAAKQPSILPSPEQTRNSQLDKDLVNQHLVGCPCKTFEGRDCRRRVGPGPR